MADGHKPWWEPYSDVFLELTNKIPPEIRAQFGHFDPSSLTSVPLEHYKKAIQQKVALFNWKAGVKDGNEYLPVYETKMKTNVNISPTRSAPKPFEEVLRQILSDSPYSQFSSPIANTDDWLYSVMNVKKQTMPRTHAYQGSPPDPHEAIRIGDYHGIPVYYNKDLKYSGVYDNTENNIQISSPKTASGAWLPDVYENNIYDTVRHEGGHAAHNLLIGQNLSPQKWQQYQDNITNWLRTRDYFQPMFDNLKDSQWYKNLRRMGKSEEDAWRYINAERNYAFNKIDQMFKEYANHPDEQFANWLSGIYGSWANEPENNPNFVNTLYEEVWKNRGVNPNPPVRRY